MTNQTDVTAHYRSAGKYNVSRLIGVGQRVGDNGRAPIVRIVADKKLEIFEPAIVVAVLAGQMSEAGDRITRAHVDYDLVRERRLIKYPLGVPERIRIAVDSVRSGIRLAAPILGRVTEFFAIDGGGPIGLGDQNKRAGGGGRADLEIRGHSDKAEGTGDEETSD